MTEEQREKEFSAKVKRIHEQNGKWVEQLKSESDGKTEPAQA